MAPTDLILVFTGGLALGVAYLAALWFSVRRLTAAGHPSPWLLATAALRLAAVLLGFYWIAGVQWQQLLVCLAGFTVARLAISRWVGANGPNVSRIFRSSEIDADNA
jgi:F1F0 ATPase subunit 2